MANNEIANPQMNPKMAAHQVIIELIRADKLNCGNGEYIIKVYNTLVEGYEKANQAGSEEK